MASYTSSWLPRPVSLSGDFTHGHYWHQNHTVDSFPWASFGFIFGFESINYRTRTDRNWACREVSWMKQLLNNVSPQRTTLVIVVMARQLDEDSVSSTSWGTATRETRQIIRRACPPKTANVIHEKNYWSILHSLHQLSICNVRHTILSTGSATNRCRSHSTFSAFWLRSRIWNPSSSEM